MSEQKEQVKDQQAREMVDLTDYGDIEYIDADFLVLEGAKPVPVKPLPSVRKQESVAVERGIPPEERAPEGPIAIDEFTPETVAEAVPAGPPMPRLGKEFIELEEAIVERIPDDFEMSNIGSVDLREAEEIANETLLVINEKEILEDLGDLRDLFAEQKKPDEDGEKPESFDIAVDLREKATVRPATTEKDVPAQVKNKPVETPVEQNVGEEYPDILAEAPIRDDEAGGVAEPRGEIIDIDVFAETEGIIPKAPLREERVKEVPLPPAEKSMEEHALPTDKKEILPQWSRPESNGSVMFIDDGLVESSGADIKSALEVNELEKITSQLLDVNVGMATLLPEGDLLADEFAPMTEELKSLQNEFIFEFVDEFKYRDDELDFIHTSIIEDDYGKYLKEIDEFSRSKGEKTVSRTVELFGLTDDELVSMHDELFGGEYKDIDLSEIFDFFKEDSVKRGLGPSIVKECTYLVSSDDSLNSEDRSSIETDISSDKALIFEENTGDIEQLLGKAARVEAKEKVELVDEIRDITDQVVIIEDDDDIDRFVSGLPDAKRGGVKKLLKYLDGLFEKLPESTVKTFANSEYFDLYLKVMKDLEA